MYNTVKAMYEDETFDVQFIFADTLKFQNRGPVGLLEQVIPSTFKPNVDLLAPLTNPILSNLPTSVNPNQLLTGIYLYLPSDLLRSSITAV
jgi:hypothetical protein